MPFQHDSPIRRTAQALILVAVLLTVAAAGGAAEFGEVSVSASAMYSGNTHHGYSEIRIALQNRSHARPHVVTLVLPDTVWNNGNSLRRLSRTVTLGPDKREVVSLLRPPLLAMGDGKIRVEIDGRREGSLQAPNANGHSPRNSNDPVTPTVLVSRGLDFDPMESAFHSKRLASSPTMATGAPDAMSGGPVSTSWIPDASKDGNEHWLELDYSSAQPVTSIAIHTTMPPHPDGTIRLMNESGATPTTVTLNPARSHKSGHCWVSEFAVPTNSVPVKTVRIDFGSSPATSIAVDAVQVSGPQGSQWAAEARASSTANPSATPYRRGGATDVDGAVCIRSEDAVSEWSGNWLAYSPFDAVALKSSELGSMPSSILGALGEYVHAGGILLVTGGTNLPSSWRPTGAVALPDGVSYSMGFGQCLTLRSALTPRGSNNLKESLRATVREAARYWERLPFDSRAANAEMPVVASLQTPVRGLVILMLAFIIIIGPVNVFYLNRINRRTWMLWTIPAISFVTTLLVFAYSLVREGITPDVRISGITVIDQTTHHAATVGAFALYCPLTPGGGLSFAYGTEATPLVRSGYGSGTARDLDWTHSQHLERGWVSARVPAHFHLRKSETRRERIQVIRAGSDLQVVNGMGSPIRSLWIADGNMSIHTGSGIPAGQQARLVRSPNPAGDAPRRSPAQLLQDIGFTVRTNQLSQIATQFLAPNTYIAELEGNPFIENALGAAASPSRTRASAVVYGFLEPAATP